jgi:hypothetical protein
MRGTTEEQPLNENIIIRREEAEEEEEGERWGHVRTVHPIASAACVYVFCAATACCML